MRGQENHPTYGPTGDWFAAEILPVLYEAHKDGIRIKEGDFKKFLKSHGATIQKGEWYFKPDDAYYFKDTNEIIIYEFKSQYCTGTADEKPAGCEWHLLAYKRWLSEIGIPPENVHMFYIFNDWFKQPKFTWMLEYMKLKGVDYCFWWDNDENKERIIHYRYIHH